jgi:hypothetical protein
MQDVVDPKDRDQPHLARLNHLADDEDVGLAQVRAFLGGGACLPAKVQWILCLTGLAPYLQVRRPAFLFSPLGLSLSNHPAIDALQMQC